MGERRGRGMVVAAAALVAVLALVAAACGSSTSSTTSAPTSAPTTTRPSGTSTTAGSSTSAGDVAPTNTVWLCFPGRKPDPCAGNLNSTVVHADGTSTVQEAGPDIHPLVDCFYVYPTVSGQPTPNANLTIESSETSVANAQASRFSQTCRVYAPMYRQLTLSAIAPGPKSTPGNSALAYADVRNAWLDYLAHDNHGRGVVLIGHSQGSFVLTQLIKQEIDPNPAVRRHLVSAVLLGGNITVPVGKDVGGSFQHVPACRAEKQTGCVVAYSSFLDPPPTNSLFGRTTVPGDQVLCTNPAALGGGTASLDSEFPATSSGLGGQLGSASAKPGTAWLTYLGRYTGTCTYQGGASWLQITPQPNDARPVVGQVLGPTWGLHLVDVNIAYDNLTTLVGDQAEAYKG